LIDKGFDKGEAEDLGKATAWKPARGRTRKAPSLLWPELSQIESRLSHKLTNANNLVDGPMRRAFGMGSVTRRA